MLRVCKVALEKQVLFMCCYFLLQNMIRMQLHLRQFWANAFRLN